jgi:pimeloyl-ACP methyl ester carboxylesterase
MGPASQIAGLLLVALLAAVVQSPTPSPPEQPASGPGGRSYAHARVASTRIGSGATEAYLFEPADPVPARAPVVVFTHGWAAMNPNIYGAWITHLVRRGHTVIYPRYQADVRTPVRDFDANALTATTHALEVLREPGHVAPDERGLVFAGHSMGGLVAANLAVYAAQGALPPPLALMSVEPGRTWPEPSPIAFHLADLSRLPSRLLLLAVVGDDDELVREVDARKIYYGATAVPPENKDYVRIFSDEHGAPTLVGDHRAPTAPAMLVDADAPLDSTQGPAFFRDFEPTSRGPMVTDAIDYYGTWKLLDGLVDAVFRGTHREYALGNTAEQRFMGRWSDRVPVRELQIEER